MVLTTYQAQLKKELSMEDRPEELLQKEAQIGRDVKHERKIKTHGRD